MGAVYRARDTELDRWVAVKCLLDVERAGSRELAVKEARTLASLSHPNIMRVFDILAVEDQIWIVSEWLEGQSLDQLPLPLPPASVLAIMTQVFGALAAAHAAQVIHRDIKPANVMINRDGRILLIDFGVAFAPGGTDEATIAGSLRYTDPRILEGETPDAASDLFSAALMQAELMTGQTVLPDLAPLPLYRHIKKHLDGRLDSLLDGSYPPLVALVRRFSSRPVPTSAATSPTSEQGAAREAALSTHDLLRKLSNKTPEQYLAGGLCQGTPADPAADRLLEDEAALALQSVVLTPRQKAAWIAFKAATEGEPFAAADTAHGSRRDGGGRTMILADFHRRRGFNRTVALATFVIASLVLWMKLGIAPRPESPKHVAGATPSIITGTGAVPAAEPQVMSTGKATGTVEAPFETRPLSLTTAPEPTRTDTSAEAPAERGGRAASPTDRATDHTAVAVNLVANAWANVILDGREIGRLPQAAPFRIPPGRHTLQLVSPSIEPHTAQITVEAGKPTRLIFNLKPKVVAHRIRLTEPGRLFVDGKDQGFVATMTIPLSYGTHEILVKRDGKTSASKTIALGPDSPTELVIE